MTDSPTVSATPPAAPPDDRADWETAVWEHLLRRQNLHPDAVTVGCVLAGYADPSGRIAPLPATAALARATGLPGDLVHVSVRTLAYRGWLRRLRVRADGPVRALVLTVPSSATMPSSTRPEP